MDTLILLVTADTALAVVVTEAMVEAGYTCRVEHNGSEALASARGLLPALMLIDVSLPDVDGFEVCRKVRAESALPILLLSDLADEVDRVVGFELGADDYIIKPFSVRELVCRVRAVLRRAWLCPEFYMAPQPVTFADVRIDPGRREVTRAGQLIDLQPRAFDLLWFLARNPGRMFTPSQLVRHVWGPDFHGQTSNVSVVMFHLRERLEVNPSKPRHLRTMKGRGYRFDQ
jgi:DNA-binding response OmpR family regulator